MQIYVLWDGHDADSEINVRNLDFVSFLCKIPNMTIDSRSGSHVRLSCALQRHL